MPGDFTNRFDREILRSKMAELEEEKNRSAKEQKELDKIEQVLLEIGRLLDRRASFLSERFGNSAREEIGGVGFKFRFDPSGDRRRAAFSMRARVNDSRLAILLESNFEIPDQSVKQYDYMSLPVQRVDLERARRFVEAKLLDFARAYTT
jgi:hypothetical protein